METNSPRPHVVDAEIAENQDNDSLKSKRANRACLSCRKRKSRCLLDNDGSIPCLRCKRDNLECVLGGSNRGGRRVRKKRVDDARSHSQTLPPLTATGADDDSFHTQGNLGTWSQEVGAQHVQHQFGHDTQQPFDQDGQAAQSDSSNTDELPFSNLQNPSDALGILARVAGETSSNEELHGISNGNSIGQPGASTTMLAPPLSFSYPLLDRGVLTVHSLCELLVRYHQQYHPYYPLAPMHAFDTSRLADMVKKEPHLLTAILLVASKDLVEEPHIYEACSEHMKSLVSNLAAGGDADIEAVEALLLLAEWAPYTQSGAVKVGKGEENKESSMESWMHVGLALRIAYFLALDQYSFRFVDQSKDPNHHRKRLVWTATYVSDRHVSIRIGKAFWSRGPGPMTTLRREDFPALMPQNPNEEDYASIFQANLELTQLFSSVHDTLYSNPSTSFRSHMSGSYIKYIDDFRAATYGWKSVWGTLTCSPPLKACLLISYDYLRLYTNAFAFQATVLRALPTTNGPADGLGKKPGLPQRVFVNNVGAVGDARFIYEGLDAAKAILTTVNNFVDPERSLRFMPLRYFLYLVYAGVFLYRARCTGVISADEDRAIRAMINETVTRLQRSSVGFEAGFQHPGSRYSQLLKLLWAKVPHKDKRGERSTFRHPGTSIANVPVDGNGFPAVQSPQQSSVGTGESPALTEQMGDFGWTDLGAVSDFAMHGNGLQGPPDEAALWNGFLPLDMGWSAQGFGVDGGYDQNGLGMLF
ncbi:hypothetical protein P153DRAFT_379767 [Dothidotthia symphoricarpi CBS 119687]|uniref:Zn(2)-C6 fungal-type domain-containing protein n=1 Tax=Dothidotthia symphoricarpi CBS 119687 TaxID=1392245 RepID=A0A6A5ZZE1_9PLEO|nr:uncharacterized protein P153DRAFT_379767 [Dothidotthia symphoricarpi CBS 119687]KAF2124253.1 hypothetical protein P153DRAFT_379767 [Dothidotthia symphoricarpi CBS 119687]